MKNNLTKQDIEKLSNKTVFFSSVTILYAMLVLFIRKMSFYSGTVNGALAFMQLLMWVSLIGAMVCAAWSAYKEKKGYYLYSGMFLFVSVSMLIIRYLPDLPDNRAYAVVFAALAAAFVLAQIYYALKVRGKFEKGPAKIIFIAVCVGVLILMAIGCLPDVTFRKLVAKVLFWK